jgi:hypothetical protein
VLPAEGKDARTGGRAETGACFGLGSTHRAIVQLDQWRLFVCEQQYRRGALNRADLAVTFRNMQVHPYRSYVLMLFRNGQLSSLGEGLIVAGVSKPTLQRWLNEAGIDWQASRLRLLNRYHSQNEVRAIVPKKRRKRRRFTKKELLRISGAQMAARFK